jgi:putative ABC transport system permease protein
MNRSERNGAHARAKPKPPALAARLLHRWLPPERHADVLGDLEEAFHARVAQSGRARSRLWYWRQAVLLSARLLPEHVQDHWLPLTRYTAASHYRQIAGATVRKNTMGTLLQDLRYAIRGLLRSPGFTAVTVTTLTLGIGANTAIFSVVHGVVLRPLPFLEADRLVALCETHERLTGFCVASPPNVEDWNTQSHTFETIGLGRSWQFLLRDADGADGVNGGYATPAFFIAYRARPLLGRLLDPEDLEPGRNHVVLLSHSLWSTRLGGSAAIVGQSVTLDGENYTVVGVLPQDFEVPQLDFVELWTPLPFEYQKERDWRGFMTIGRLNQEVSLEEARSEMLAITARLAQQYPETNEGWGLELVPLHERVVGSARSTLLVFLGAVGFVLLIGCVNVANLVLARSAERQREFAVRAALGADRLRLVRQMLTESLLLAAVGGITGVLTATWALRAFIAIAPSNIPRLDEVSIDGWVLGFAVIVSIFTSVLFGFAPAVRATKVDLTRSLKEGQQGYYGWSGLGVRNLLVISEVALALMLLVGAGLLTRSFATAVRWDPGFDRENLLTVSVFGSPAKYTTGAKVNRLFQQAVEDVESLPGVGSVGATSAGPLFGGRETTELSIVGRPEDAERRPVARWYDIDPNYVRTLGVPLLGGRYFTAADDAAAPPVAMINETMALRYWPDEDPLGSRVTVLMGDPQIFTVVGVVGDVTPFRPDAAPEPEIFWPKLQWPRLATFLVIRTASEPTSLVRAVRERLYQLDPDLSLGSFRTMEQLVDRQLVRPRFNMLLLGIFALVALTLAAVGIFGVISYAVSHRTHEIGLRMSLGAGRQEILGLVIRDGLKLVAAGLTIGVGGALGLTRGLSSMLMGTSPTDPQTFVGVTVVLVGVALLACYLPARRAARVDPMVALRQQ